MTLHSWALSVSYVLIFFILHLLLALFFVLGWIGDAHERIQHQNNFKHLYSLSMLVCSVYCRFFSFFSVFRKLWVNVCISLSILLYLEMGAFYFLIVLQCWCHIESSYESFFNVVPLAVICLSKWRNKILKYDKRNEKKTQ